MKGVVIFFSVILIGVIAATRKGHASEVPALPPKPPEPIRLPPVIVTPDHVDDETHADITKALDENAATLPTKFTSVISGVDDAKWSAYVLKQKNGKLNTVSATNNLGLFLIGYPVLKDLGYVTNLRKETVNGRQVWNGDFIPPLTRDKFLSTAMLQYEAFAKMEALQAKVIQTKYKDVIAGSTITLSGLLAVAKFAGLGGLDSWLKEPAKRKAETTNEFNAFNGMF